MLQNSRIPWPGSSRPYPGRSTPPNGSRVRGRHRDGALPGRYRPGSSRAARAGDGVAPQLDVDPGPAVGDQARHRPPPWAQRWRTGQHSGGCRSRRWGALPFTEVEAEADTPIGGTTATLDLYVDGTFRYALKRELDDGKGRLRGWSPYGPNLR